MTLSNIQTTSISSTQQVTQLQKVTQKICDEAWEVAYTPLVREEQTLHKQQLFQRSDFFPRFKGSLAQGVAQTLAQHDQRVQAIYLFEPAVQLEAREASALLSLAFPLHLLVVVAAPSAALDALVMALNEGLRQCLAQLSPVTFSEESLILEVNLVTPEAVERGTGLGRLLLPLKTPPCKLWDRNV